MTSVLILRSRALLFLTLTPELHFAFPPCCTLYISKDANKDNFFLTSLQFFFSMCSLQAFVKDASSFSHEAVDRLLDVLTEGAHSKYVKHIAEVRLSELCESWSLDA